MAKTPRESVDALLPPDDLCNRLVQQNIEFTVVEKKTQTDITRIILLQVITEQEHSAEPIMSREFLSQVIRSYGTPLQHGIAGALDQSVRQVA
jgi:polyhydroxyalkanoate synthesis repressor PhaR